jgi:hypothetical protein
MPHRSLWQKQGVGVEVLPNHSVNLTRNSAPHLPGVARYAHTDLQVKRVTLPRAGYLERSASKTRWLDEPTP